MGDGEWGGGGSSGSPKLKLSMIVEGEDQGKLLRGVKNIFRKVSSVAYVSTS